MSTDKICPHCGALNEHLDLNETSGLFVCCNCQCLIDVKTGNVTPYTEGTESESSALRSSIKSDI